MSEEKLFWVTVEIGIDAMGKEEAMEKLRDIILNIESVESFNWLIHKAEKDESFESLQELRKDKKDE